MDSKQFLKITSFLFISFIIYIIFFIFFLSPKINDYLTNKSLEISKEQFEKLKKDLEDYFSDKQLLLDIVGNIRQMNESCHIENNGSLILFEDYIKKI